MNKNEFNIIIDKFKSIKDKAGNNLNMYALAIQANEDTFYHHFEDQGSIHDLRSVCKCVVSLCVGIAIDEKTIVNNQPLSLDTLIWDTIKDFVELKNKKNLVHLEKVTLRHLLTHTIGYEDKLLKSKDIKGIDPLTYLELVVNYDIKHSPGSYFVYSNAAPYILSAFMQIATGYNLSEYANNKIFSKLSISEYKWKNYGHYCAGGTGLKLHIEDLLKIGTIMLNKGKYKSVQIVTEKWIEQMSCPQILTPSMFDSSRVFPKYGYGFLMWVCNNGTYYCDGTDGQYLIVVPRRKLIMATFAKQPDMKPITKCFEDII